MGRRLTFEDPKTVMERFASWLTAQTNGRPSFVSDNLAFDWQFINYCFHRFLGQNPFGFSGRRIGDLYAGLVKDASKADATHCREFAPANADELHQVGGVLMSNRRSETLGWQLLYEGMTGLRSEETVLLRMDARADEPGGVMPDGGSMCVRRAKKSKKFNLYVQVYEGLKLVRQAHAIWHAHRYPHSPWCFPGRARNTFGHVDKSSLTKSLDRLYQVYVDFRKTEKDPTKFPKEPHLTRKYTSHGAGRAFYVLVRRSQGASDLQIAYELNQIGGVSTLEQVYGLPPEHWKNGNAPKLSWIPKGFPAWSKIKGIDFSPANAERPTVAESLSFDI